MNAHLRTAILLAVQDALTEDERARMLAIAWGANPHLRGCHVADWLELCDARDAFIDECHQRYDDAVQEAVRVHGWTLVRIAAIAVCSLHHLDIQEDSAHIVDLVRRAAALL